jgi:predicted component of type VI protein secretion system
VRPQIPYMNTQLSPYHNEWKRYHNSLDAQQGKRFKARIEYVLCISQSAFYRKIKQPDKFLTTAEKWAIARIYNLKEEYLFPELEDMG